MFFLTIIMPRFLKKKVQEIRETPHQVAARKFTNAETKRYAIQEGINAVKKCWPYITISLGDIMDFDLNTRNNKKNNVSNYPNALSNKCGPLNKGQVLFVFKNAADNFCENHDRERMFGTPLKKKKLF